LPQINQVVRRIKELEDRVVAEDIPRLQNLEELQQRILRIDGRLAGTEEQLKSDLGSLNRRIDDITAETASQRDMQALQETIHRLSNRFAQLPVAETEQRLNEIAQALAQTKLQERDLPQVDQLSQRVEEIEDRLAKAVLEPQRQDFQELEQRFQHVDERLAGTEDQLSAIAGIERSISQLFRALEDHQEDVPEIAEQAARRVVQEFAEVAPAAAAGPAPQIRMLEEALAELRERGTQSEQRTQETLDAVHDTFEGIVNKLTELEAGQRAVLEAGIAGSRGSEAETPASHDIPPAMPEWQNVLRDEMAEASRAAQAAHAENGQHADIFATNDESLGEARTTEPVEDDDFIAAARRAAQAAAVGARMSSRYASGADMTGQGQKTSRAKPKFSLSLFQRAPALKPRRLPGLSQDIAAAADMATMPPDNKRRRLLLAALLLLIAVSAYALRSGQKESPAPEPAPQGLIEPTASTGLASLQTQQWYRAAFDGVAQAQYRLGTMYEHGTGVERNIEEAKLWYEKAAVQGNVKAMHNLGSLLSALDMPDYTGAAEWFLLAARYGVKDSQYNIALLYEQGLGVQQDAVEAYFWYSAAARQGDVDALARSRTVEELLPLEVKSAARRRLNEWRPLEAPTEANSA
jgi:localization factor PodJL